MCTRSSFRSPPIRLLLVAAVLWAAGGCMRDPLFEKDVPRTQFETYDRMHGRVTPVEAPDVFGNPQPALRARLSRK